MSKLIRLPNGNAFAPEMVTCIIANPGPHPLLMVEVGTAQRSRQIYWEPPSKEAAIVERDRIIGLVDEARTEDDEDDEPEMTAEEELKAINELEARMDARMDAATVYHPDFGECISAESFAGSGLSDRVAILVNLEGKMVVTENGAMFAFNRPHEGYIGKDGRVHFLMGDNVISGRIQEEDATVAEAVAQVIVDAVKNEVAAADGGAFIDCTLASLGTGKAATLTELRESMRKIGSAKLRYMMAEDAKVGQMVESDEHGTLRVAQVSADMSRNDAPEAGDVGMVGTMHVAKYGGQLTAAEAVAKVIVDEVKKEVKTNPTGWAAWAGIDIECLMSQHQQDQLIHGDRALIFTFADWEPELRAAFDKGLSPVD